MLESGGLEQEAETHPLNRVIQLGRPYAGAERGRFRCLGGTSTRWGGALLPFSEQDLSARPYLGLPAFPLENDELKPYRAVLERLFGIDEGSYEEEFVNASGAGRHVPTGDPDFKARFAKWPTFRNRNLAVLFGNLIKRDPDLQVLINSNATEFNLDTAIGRIAFVKAQSSNRRSVKVFAKQTVICAGALETTRLLLLLDQQYGGRVFHGCDALGRYFYDHISTQAASITPGDVTKLNRMAGLRFVGSTIRSLRFELSSQAQESEQVGSAFGHISFRTSAVTGFDALREFLRSRQRNGQIQPRLLLSALKDVPYLSRLGYWRVIHNQLLWPVPSEYELHVVTEQLPSSENYIGLASEVDDFGLPLAAIKWQVAPRDLMTYNAFVRRFAQFWKRHGLDSTGDLNWKNQCELGLGDQAFQADVYHPGGSTRMGTDRHAAVLDSNLKVFSVPNLWAVSTAAFPSGGGANPTMTLMLFALRLADHLGKT